MDIMPIMRYRSKNMG